MCQRRREGEALFISGASCLKWKHLVNASTQPPLNWQLLRMDIIAGPCSFESGLCGWKDNSLGTYQWTRNKGATIAAGTGPSVDHTCGNASCK